TTDPGPGSAPAATRVGARSVPRRSSAAVIAAFPTGLRRLDPDQPVDVDRLIEDAGGRVVVNDRPDGSAIDLECLAVGVDHALDPFSPQLIGPGQVAEAHKRGEDLDQLLEVGGIVEPCCGVP